MIFKTILSIRYRNKFKLLAFSLVISLLMSISGCTTTENHRVRSDTLPSETEYEIVKLVMKNSLLINLRGKSAHYVKEYEGKKNLIFYSAKDTIRASEDSLNIFSKNKITDTTKDTALASVDSMIVYPTIKIIELDSVRWVTIKKTEVDVGKTILYTVGIIVVLLSLILLGGSSDEDEGKKDNKDYEPDDPDHPENKKNNEVPNKPGLPSPADNSLNIPKLVELTWKCTDPNVDDNLKYDVYADSTNPPKVRVVRNISSNKFQLGLIAPNTKMYWQVIAKDEYKAERRGPVWCFTTGN